MAEPKLLAILSGPLPQSSSAQLAMINSIKQQLEEIDSSQNDGWNDDTVAEERINQFQHWLLANNVTAIVDGVVRIQYYKTIEGFGLCAQRDIKAGELCLAIPRRLMLTEAECPVLNSSPLSSDPLVSSTPSLRLALFLLMERFGRPPGESFWWPYLALLPRTFTTPLHYDRQTLTILQTTTLFPEIARLYMNIARQFVHLRRLAVFPAKVFTWNRFLWAVSVVMTRQNQIISPTTGAPIMALIPLWDLCNHKNGPITTFYDHERQESQSFAMTDTLAGEELYISYGSRSSGDLMLHSGFVVDYDAQKPPEAEYLKLSVPLPTDYRVRAQLIDQLGVAAIKDGGKVAVVRCYPVSTAKDERNRLLFTALSIALGGVDDSTVADLVNGSADQRSAWLSQQLASQSVGKGDAASVEWLRLKLTVYSRLLKRQLLQVDLAKESSSSSSSLFRQQLAMRYVHLELRLIDSILCSTVACDFGG